VGDQQASTPRRLWDLRTSQADAPSGGTREGSKISALGSHSHDAADLVSPALDGCAEGIRPVKISPRGCLWRRATGGGGAISGSVATGQGARESRHTGEGGQGIGHSKTGRYA
jgi:hypothetical protein